MKETFYSIPTHYTKQKRSWNYEGKRQGNPNSHSSSDNLNNNTETLINPFKPLNNEEKTFGYRRIPTHISRIILHNRRIRIQHMENEKANQRIKKRV